MKKNTFFMAGALALLASVLVLAGCDSPLQEGGTVHIAQNSGPSVASVSAVVTSGNLAGESGKGVIIKWDAVDGGTGYDVYYQYEGKKTVVTMNYGFSWVTAPGYGTFSATGAYSNSDLSNTDTWGCTALTGNFQSGKRVRFGVTANAIGGGYGSGVVWSDYVTIPAP